MSDSRVLGDDLEIEFDRAGPNLTVYLSGELDRSTGPRALARIVERFDGVTHLVLDVSALTYLDAGGLRTISAVQDHVAGTEGCRLVVFEPSGIVDCVLRVSGIDQVVHVVGRRA